MWSCILSFGDNNYAVDAVTILIDVWDSNVSGHRLLHFIRACTVCSNKLYLGDGNSMQFQPPKNIVEHSFLHVTTVYFQESCRRIIINFTASIVSGHSRTVSETPYKWRFAGGPIVALCYMLTGNCIYTLQNIEKLLICMTKTKMGSSPHRSLDVSCERWGSILQNLRYKRC